MYREIFSEISGENKTERKVELLIKVDLFIRKYSNAKKIINYIAVTSVYINNANFELVHSMRVHVDFNSLHVRAKSFQHRKDDSIESSSTTLSMFVVGFKMREKERGIGKKERATKK